jgi:hypothetical protein
MKQKRIKKELFKPPFETKGMVFAGYKLSYDNNIKYDTRFNSAYLGTYENLYNLALEIVKNEKPDSEFEENLINYIDGCEPLFEIGDKLRFDNLENIIKEHNLILIMGIVGAGLNCTVVGVPQWTRFEINKGF